MIPAPGEGALLSDPVFDLFDVREIKDEMEASRQVERGRLVAALTIPSEFSQSLAESESSWLDLYVNGRYEMSGIAVESVVETLSNLLSTGEITLRTAAMGVLPYARTKELLESGKLDEALMDLARRAIEPAASPIAIERSATGVWSARIAWRRYLAAAIAVLFAGFMALAGSASLFGEKTQGTLRRMQMTLAGRWTILGGKGLGWYLSGLSQISLLAGGVLALERIVAGGGAGHRSSGALGYVLLMLVIPLAATGVAAAIAALADSYSRAIARGGAALVVMGLVGGVFFPVSLLPAPLRWISRATYPYWAMDAYVRLATGAEVASVLPHVLALGTIGILGLVAGGCLLQFRSTEQ
jgi:ABC-type multidrug transport system permease subunit